MVEASPGRSCQPQPVDLLGKLYVRRQTDCLPDPAGWHRQPKGEPVSLVRYFKLYDRLERALQRGMEKGGWDISKVVLVWSRYTAWSLKKAREEIRERAKKR